MELSKEVIDKIIAIIQTHDEVINITSDFLSGNLVLDKHLTHDTIAVFPPSVIDEQRRVEIINLLYDHSQNMKKVANYLKNKL